MKNSFSRSVSRWLSAAGLCSLAVLAACGDSSSASKSKAEECANGLSSECLIGTWSMLGFANLGTGEMMPTFDYTAMPGSMTFSEDGTFELVVPVGAPADMTTEDCNPIYGTWTVESNALSMKSTRNGMCLAKKSASFTPVIANDGSQIKMSLGGLWLLENATDEQSIKSYATEVYTISAK